MITPWISLVAATAAVAAAAPYTAALDDSKSRDDAVGGLQDEDVIDVGGESCLAPLGPGQPASHDHRRESRRRTLLVRQRQTPEGIRPRGQDRKPALGHVRSQGRGNPPDPRADADPAAAAGQNSNPCSGKSLIALYAPHFCTLNLILM